MRKSALAGDVSLAGNDPYAVGTVAQLRAWRAQNSQAIQPQLVSASPDLAATKHPQRWLRWVSGLLAAIMLSVFFGITTARTELYLGPHTATYYVTLAGKLVVDMGPLGSMRINSPVTPLGLDVVVGEVPGALTEATTVDSLGVNNSTVAELSGDLYAYVEFFSNPHVTINRVVRSLAIDALLRAGIALLTLAGLTAAAYFILGERRRAELSARIRPRVLIASGAAFALAAVVGIDAAAGVHGAELLTTPALALQGTVLEGAEVTGKLAGLVDSYGQKAMNIFADNQEFYAKAKAAMDDAWDARELAEQEAGAILANTSPVSSAAPVTYLVVSDIHCNVSMAALIKDIAEKGQVAAIINAGDTTMNGTAVERYCVDAINESRPDGIPMIAINGNHDSAEIAAAQKALGQNLLTGQVEEVAGLRVLGHGSPDATRMGHGTTGTETPAQLGEELVATACAGDIDLLLVHEPDSGDAPLASGCVPFQISGHTHRRAGPFIQGYGVRYVNASTAGATTGKLTVGPLNGTAEMTLLRFDPETRQFTDWKLIEVTKDATSAVSPWYPIVHTDTKPSGANGGSVSTPKPSNSATAPPHLPSTWFSPAN